MSNPTSRHQAAISARRQPAASPARHQSTTPARRLLRTVLVTPAALLLTLAATTPAQARAAAHPQDAAHSRVAAHPQDAADPGLSVPALGAAAAPVDMIEYGDFQCPLCDAFFQQTEPELIKEYVTPGTVRLDWRDFANRGPESTAAAVAARAAARQGAFWQYHDYLYSHQYWENSGLWDRAFLLKAAQTLGLDTGRFAADLDDPALEASVVADSTDARRWAPDGTPTFYINGQLVEGNQPIQVFRDAIAKALAPRDGGAESELGVHEHFHPLRHSARPE